MKIALPLTAAVALIAGQGVPAHAEVLIPELPRKAAKTNEDFEKARASAADSEKAYEAGKLDEALMHAAAGYQIYPNASTASVVAFVLGEKGRRKESVLWYILALNLEPPPFTVEEIEKILVTAAKKLDTPIGWLRLERNPKTARITIDGELLKEGITVVGVSPGEHRIQAEADGFESIDRTVSFEALRANDLPLNLTKLPSSSPAGESDATSLSASAESGDPIAGWALVGTGAALSITGGVLIGLAVDAADKQGGLGPGEGAQWDELNDRKEAFEIGGWVAGGVGLGVLTAGIVLLALDGGGSLDESPVTTISPIPGGATASTSWRF